MLSPYRVLDCSDDRGELAGFVLAALGADVIAVEPPGGSPSRHRGPFRDGVPDADTSFSHWAYARGKRSVVLDLAGSSADRDAFLGLVEGADVVIESAGPGVWDALGLGYDVLSARNPAVVLASVSAFGADGPKARWHATDLTVWASAGPLVITGDADRAPVRPSVPQAFLHASAEIAGAIVAALYERATSGVGQHLDASAQQACMQATQSMVLAAPNHSEVALRGAGRIRLGPIELQLLWACLDGYVSITFVFGSGIGPASARLMQWIHDEGECDAATRDKDWIGYGALLASGEEPVAEYDRVKDVITAFCARRTKAELLAGAMERRLLIAPVAMIDDVVHSPQFAARDYWHDVGGITYPGAIARPSMTPLPVLGPPPRLGQHTAAVLAEAARHPTVAARAAAGTPPAGDPPGALAAVRRPLDGVKVLDLMWVMAGPAGTRTLADLGATVVRVESGRRIETARTLQPFRDNVIGTDSSCLFANLNAGKLGMALDLTMPDGRAVLEDLVRWADVVTESFSPRAMRSWGLDYEALRKLNPGIVMMSSCLFGQSGPYALFAGYGTMAAALSGFFGVTGWPDRAPCGPYGAYTDYLSPRFATAVLLAALDHRRRTGVGQYIDFAQSEAAMHALTPALLEYTVNGTVPARAGNDDPCFHPHGVYPCRGDDVWVALACTDDAMRAALARLTGGLDDADLSRWTSERDPEAAADALQAAGVAAHALQNSPELMRDPQLAHRRHFRTLAHPVMGEVVVEGPRVEWSRTPADVLTAAPTLGEHTAHVLAELLGYDDDRVVELLIGGALE